MTIFGHFTLLTMQQHLLYAREVIEDGKIKIEVVGSEKNNNEKWSNCTLVNSFEKQLGIIVNKDENRKKYEHD